MSKIKITEEQIEINGKTYIPIESLQKSPNYQNTPIKIVVLQRGWIYIGRFSKDETGTCKLENAYCIRIWGTTKGLQELVNGVTPKTILDKCEGVVEFDWLTVIHTITVNPEKWQNI